MENKTAMQDLAEKVNDMIEANKKYKSQFHQGFLYAMGMVKEVIEEKLLEDEKQQIIDAYHINPNESIYGNIGPDYYNQTYNTNEQHSSK